MGGPGDDGVAEGLVLEASGGGAVTGYFSETAELGGGPTRSAGGTDVFVTRFGPSDGDLWAVGPLQWRTDFGGQTPLAAGGFDAYLSRLAGDGALVWVQRLTRSDVQAHSVSLDAQERAWVSGHFKESLTVGETTLRSQGKSDVWFGVFSSGGHLLAARSFGGPGSEYGYAIAVSPRGGVVLSGQFNGQLRACGRTLTSAGGSDAFRVRVTLPLAGQY